MGKLVAFVPRPDIESERNLQEFVRLCRTEISVFGADLKFDLPVWDLTDYIQEKARKSTRSITFDRLDRTRGHIRSIARILEYLRDHPDECLAEGFIDFAKAYIRYMHALRPTIGVPGRLKALRCIEAALREQIAHPSTVNPTKLTYAQFNRAAALAREHFAPSTAYTIGCHLKTLADFLSRNHLLAASLQWSNPIPRAMDGRRLGPEADEQREKKMPSQSALDALARLFPTATKPRDVVTTGVSATILSAPMRIHELLLVPDNCQVVREIKERKTAYGLRWYSGKAGGPSIKWLSSEMAPVVKLALARIKAISEPARIMAKWYEDHPSEMYLPKHLKYLRGRQRLDRHEITAIMGFRDHRSVGTFLVPRGILLSRGPVSFETIEKIVLSMLPHGFPWLDKRVGVRYSDALFVLPLNLMHSYKGTCPVMFHAVSTPMLRNDLAAKGCIFDRYDCRDDAGKPIRLTTHQARHLLNTLAMSGGMSQFETAKWSGRKDINQNRYYDHRSPAEMLKLIRAAVGDCNKLIGPLSMAPKTIPISRQEFSLQMIPTAHATELGWCIHDYTSAPCELIDDCINCQEQVCVKGEKAKNEWARELLKIEMNLLRKALEAEVDHQYGADRWQQHHTQTVTRLQELVSILDDPEIPNGSVIQLACGKPVHPIKQAVGPRRSLTEPGR